MGEENPELSPTQSSTSGHAAGSTGKQTRPPKAMISIPVEPHVAEVVKPDLALTADPLWGWDFPCLQLRKLRLREVRTGRKSGPFHTTPEQKVSSLATARLAGRGPGDVYPGQTETQTSLSSLCQAAQPWEVVAAGSAGPRRHDPRPLSAASAGNQPAGRRPRAGAVGTGHPRGPRGTPLKAWDSNEVGLQGRKKSLHQKKSLKSLQQDGKACPPHAGATPDRRPAPPPRLSPSAHPGPSL